MKKRIHQPSVEELQEQNALLIKEVGFARKASKLTASRVVAQFDKMGQIQSLLEEKVATEKELRGRAEIKERELERRAAEIEEARDLFQQVIESMSEALFLMNLEGYVVRANRAAGELLRRDPKELVGQRYDDVCGNGEIPATPWNVQEHLRDGRSLNNVDVDIDTRDGRTVPVSISCGQVCDERGKTTGVLIVARDITQRKQAEKALRQSEERISLILQNAPDAVVTIDADGIITGWNKQAKTTFGWSREEAIGRRLGETIIPPEYREAHYRGMQHFLTTGDAPILNKRIEITAIRRGGSQFPVSLTVLPVRSGDTFTFSAFISDVTERKEAEETIGQSEKKYRSLVETTRTGFLIVDEKGRVIDANAEYVKLTGHLTLQDIKVRSVLQWTAEHDLKRHAEELRKCIQQGSVWGLEIDYVDKDGNITPVEINATVDEHGRIVSLCRDISERREAEQTLERKTQELEWSNSELKEFASVVSHDLKSPLGQVFRNAQRLRRDAGEKLDDSGDDRIASIIDAARHMERLIDDLHKYSEVGKEELVEPVDCAAVFDQVCSFLEPRIEESAAKLTSDSLPTVIANPTDLVQVFQNLIGNAIKFRADGRPLEIHVGARRQDDDVLFWVSDNGIGIEPEYADKIFQIFERLPNAKGIEGTGIGLANCKKAVERRGGRIWVDSEPDQGSTFYFALPASGLTK